MTVRSLAKQRLRWTFGNLQAFWKNRGTILRPRYRVLGMLVLPYTVLSILIPLVFMPLTYLIGTLAILDGHWQPIVYFAIFIAGLHMLTAIAAVVITRERWWHVLVVPGYRLIYEPLWAYLLYGSLLRVIRGRNGQWYRPARTNTVRYAAGDKIRGARTAPSMREVHPRPSVRITSAIEGAAAARRHHHET